MSINALLRKFNNMFAVHTSRFYTLGFDKQKHYLDSFPEPRNDIERSYYQYLCQVFSCESRLSYLLKVISSTVLYLIEKNSVRYIENDKSEIAPVIYLSVNHKKNMLPKEITSTEYKYIAYDKSHSIDDFDKLFMKEIEEYYPHSYYFLYKVFLKIGFYSFVINKYSPRKIVVHGETSFTSSILTLYCERRGIRHINVMHGEKAFLIRDAFFRFSDCYVWSDYHVNLFQLLRAGESNYIVSTPPSMVINKSSIKINSERVHDYTFYLGYETKKSLTIIKNAVLRLEHKGKTVQLRPHPSYTNYSQLLDFFSDKYIENPQKVGIEESILHTKNVVSI